MSEVGQKKKKKVGNSKTHGVSPVKRTTTSQPHITAPSGGSKDITGKYFSCFLFWFLFFPQEK